MLLKILLVTSKNPEERSEALEGLSSPKSRQGPCYSNGRMIKDLNISFYSQIPSSFHQDNTGYLVPNIGPRQDRMTKVGDPDYRQLPSGPNMRK